MGDGHSPAAKLGIWLPRSGGGRVNDHRCAPAAPRERRAARNGGQTTTVSKCRLAGNQPLQLNGAMCRRRERDESYATTMRLHGQALSAPSAARCPLGRCSQSVRGARSRALRGGAREEECVCGGRAGLEFHEELGGSALQRRWEGSFEAPPARRPCGTPRRPPPQVVFASARGGAAPGFGSNQYCCHRAHVAARHGGCSAQGPSGVLRSACVSESQGG